MKICCKCKKELPLTEFWKHKSSKDGLRYMCKTCCKNKFKKYYNSKRGKQNILNSIKKYQKTDKGKKALSKASLKYFKTNKGKFATAKAQSKYQKTKLGKKTRRIWYQNNKIIKQGNQKTLDSFINN